MRSIKLLLSKLIGTENTLNNNILFIDFTGSHEKAQFLSQVFYWSEKTKNKDGWFAKNYADWFNEIRVKEHSIRRYTKEFVKAGFMETKFKKWNNVPTLHYRLNSDLLIELLMEFCEANNLSGSHEVRVEANNLSGSRLTQCKPPLTENTTENTTETKEEHAEESAPLPDVQKEQPKSDLKKRKKVAPKKEIPTKELSTERPEIHLAIDKMNERYSEWCIIRGIGDGEVIQFNRKECGQLKSLLKTIRKEAGRKSFEYATNTEFIEGAFNAFLSAYIQITKAYQGKGAGWFTTTFKPSQMVSNYQDIRDTFKLIKNGAAPQASHQSTGVTDNYKASILAELS